MAEREPEFMNAGIAPLYEKRWQATVLCIDNLFPIFEPFCQAWDHSRFTSPGALPSGEATAVTDAVSSNLFRQYVFMVHSVHKLVSGFESWLESCPCHHLAKKSGKRKAGWLSEQGQGAACPMRGKRACELAAGALEGLLDSLGELASQSWAHADAGAALSPEEHATLQQDFEYAKVFLNFGLKTKLKFWTTVPWRLCGLRHHWTSVARSVAKACLDEYDEAMQNTQVLDAHHHPLTVKFLSFSGPLRQAVEAFAAGQEMGNELALAVARLKFVPCVERVVEGLHRDVKIAAKHVQLGPTRVSLTVRLKEIKVLHEQSAENASELTRHFNDVRHLKQAAAMLGVLHHPSILELLFNQVTDTGTWWIRLQHVVHRCNLQEQFTSHAAARALHDKKRKSDRDTQDRLHGRQALQPPRTYEGILKRFICDRLKELADSSRFLTIPVLEGEDSYQIVPLDGRAPQQVAGAAVESEEGLVFLEEAEVTPPAEVLVLRILHSNPSRLKLAPAPLAAKPAFPSGACAVALHDLVSEHWAGPCIRLNSKTVPMLLQDLERCSLSTLRSDVFVWGISPKVMYTLPCPGFTSRQVSECVTAVVTQNGVPDELFVLVPSSQAEVCRRLASSELLLILKPRDGDGLLVRLTELGMSKLQVISDLVGKEALCARKGRSLTDSDSLDLALDLEGAGWVWSQLPSRKRQREALEYRRGSAKTWYSQSHVVNHAYLKCLLDADRIFDHGAVDCIPHWVKEPGKIYPAILRGEPCALHRLEQPALEYEGDAVEDAEQVSGKPGARLSIEAAAKDSQEPDGSSDESGMRLSENPELEDELIRLLDAEDPLEGLDLPPAGPGVECVSRCCWRVVEVIFQNQKGMNEMGVTLHCPPLCRHHVKSLAL